MPESTPTDGYPGLDSDSDSDSDSNPLSNSSETPSSPSPLSTSVADDTPLEWHLTPSNAGLLRWLLYASWVLSGGFLFSLGLLTLVIAANAVGDLVSISIPDPTRRLALAVVVTGPVTTVFGLGWLALERLRRSHHGLTFCRLRLPEPSDPRRSIVEHASPVVLSALATAGALGYGLLFATTAGLERRLAPGLVFGLLLATHVGLVAVRWWLPTAGTFDTHRRTLSIVSFPHDGVDADIDDRSGRRWHGALETAVELPVDDIERVRRITLGGTSILVCSGSVRVPIVAVIPPGVAETIVDEHARIDRP